MIEFKQVTKLFNKKGLAGVKDLSFKINKGEIIALLGPSGHGKTTTLNLILNTLHPDSGQITLNSTEVELVEQFPKIANNLTALELLVQSIKDDVSEEKKITIARMA